MAGSRKQTISDVLNVPSPMTAERNHEEIQRLLRAEIAQLRKANTSLSRQLARHHKGTDDSTELEALKHRHAIELTLAHQTHIVWHQGHGEHLPPLPKIIERLNASPLFDADWYAARDPNLQEVGMSPAEHYSRAGSYEGRDPSPHFDTMGYYLANPDVAGARWPALLHYEMFGKAEGRLLYPDG